jgi:hypothetical protein
MSLNKFSIELSLSGIGNRGEFFPLIGLSNSTIEERYLFLPTTIPRFFLLRRDPKDDLSCLIG